MHKEFPCDVAGCGGTFSQKWLLRRHKARKHESEERPCDTCAQHSETRQWNAGAGKCANREKTTGEFAKCDGAKDPESGKCDKCEGEWLEQGFRIQNPSAATV